MTFPGKITILAISFIAALFLTAGYVSAQEYQQEGYQQEGMMQQPGAQINVSEADLDKAAGAYVEITEIRENFQESLAGITDPEQAQELQEQAGEAMVEAVQNNGLDVQQYNEIMEAAQADEELRNKLLGKLEAMQ
ncbi:DUF4168 domain-containing protein [Desulfonatronovibrio magnus]|uniref:DUF4168 domain-containing protein n=1 Tax=Desulfonatronovibrio magnus TaxID=698827 RepID=UPI0005EBA77E|nr:DUF4168 domain-containing protein [Desulfonatronovibrio magnus]